MQDLNSLIERYLSACLYHKGLNSKTIKAYRIDLHQFSRQASRLWYSKEQVIDYQFTTLQTYIVNHRQNSQIYMVNFVQYSKHCVGRQGEARIAVAQCGGDGVHIFLIHQRCLPGANMI